MSPASAPAPNSSEPAADRGGDSASPAGADHAGAPEAEVGEPPPIDLGVAGTLPVSASPLTSLIDNAPTPARAASMRLTEQARQSVSAGLPSEAIRALTRALSIDSSNPQAYFYLGRAYFLKKDYHQALTFFQRAEIGLAGDQKWLGEALSFEGACYEQSGQTTRAAVAYKRALDSSPYNLMARAGYGRLVSVAPSGSDSEVAPASDEAPPESNAPPPPESQPPLEGAPSESVPPGPASN